MCEVVGHQRLLYVSHSLCGSLEDPACHLAGHWLEFVSKVKV